MAATTSSDQSASASPDAAGSLPDPDAFPGRPVVLFDDQCRFCKASVRFLRRFDIGDRRLSYLGMTDRRVAERYSDLTHEQLMEEMVVVDPDGKRHGGSEAVRYLSRRLPALWLAMPVLHLPGSAGLWRRLYAMVARNRYRIAGRDCDSGTCRIR